VAVFVIILQLYLVKTQARPTPLRSSRAIKLPSCHTLLTLTLSQWLTLNCKAWGPLMSHTWAKRERILLPCSALHNRQLPADGAEYAITTQWGGRAKVRCCSIPCHRRSRQRKSSLSVVLLHLLRFERSSEHDTPLYKLHRYKS